MKATLTILLSLIFSSELFSQSVFGEKLDYKFAGSNYSPAVKVFTDKDRVTLTLYDNDNKIAIRQNILFENLPLGRYLSFYNSIGLLNDGNDNLFLFDFIEIKKYPYDGQYNRYNEGIAVGKFNPILKKNVLKIIDENLNLIKSLTLDIKPNSKEYWVLVLEGTDVIKGKVSLLKCVKQEVDNSKNIYHSYEYDVLENSIKRIK
ncbi:MAG: hypothetical protein EBZ95_08690 [Chitinophagia bacterium]|jgi:hypothetical protein|nr:hypothetical protein [Chitinophagia bacterium]